MRLPDPIANTTTEAYLAYKAGVLEVGDLKPSLYDPYLHFDAWLAYWCGLTNTYPNKGEGDNLYNVYDYKTGSGGVKPDKSGYITLSYDNSAGASNAYMTYFTNNLDLETSTEYAIVMEVKQVSGSGTMYIVSSNQATGTYSQFSLNNTINFSDLSDGDVIVVKNTTRSEFTVPGAGTRSYARFAAGEKGSITVRLSVLANTSVTPSSFSYEPHFTPEMLTDEEALVAYLSGVTNTYPEEIKDPYDVRIVGYLKYLVSVKYGRPEYPVNNEEFYLSLLMPPSVSNDTPASSIILQGTAKYPFLDLLMYGDCAQQTYTGKNLLDCKSHQATQTGGLTWTIDSDGIFTITGIPTSNYRKVVNQFDIDGILVDGATYTLSKTAGGRYIMPQIVLINKQTSVETYINVTEPYYSSFVVDKSTYTYKAAVQSSSMSVWGEDSRTITVGFQLEAGSTATDYEPYVGGIPAPNPDYPQEVYMVTGKQTVKATGKNLFNNQSIEIGKNYNGAVGTIAYPFNAQSDRAAVLIPIEPSTAYNFSMTDGSLYLMEVRECSADYTVTRRVSAPNSDSVDFNFTSQSNGKYLVAEFKSGSAGTEVITQAMADALTLQLEMGSTATSYEPYQSKSTVVPLTCKNMFNKDATPTHTSLTTVTPLENGIRVKVGTAGNYRYVQYVLQDISKYENPVIAIQSKIEASASNKPRLAVGLCAKDGSNSIIRRAIDASGSVLYTPTAADRVGRPYLVVYFYANMDGTGNVGDYVDYTDVQIEISNAPTDYVPYHPPIELCKIGDYQDYIYKDQDGDWYLRKNTGKVVYSGASSEYWSKLNLAFQTAVTDNKGPQIATAYSNYFSYYPTQTAITSTIGNGQFGWNTANTLTIRNDSCADATAFRTWLQSHNTAIYYNLATPTDTLITYSDVVDALNEILAGGSYKDTTYIEVTADDDNLPGLLTVTAGKE